MKPAMTETNFILERIAAKKDQPALFWRGKTYDGDWLVGRVAQDVELLRGEGIRAGSVVLLQGDYSPQNVSLLLAMIQLRTIIAPLLSPILAMTPTLLYFANASLQ